MTAADQLPQVLQSMRPARVGGGKRGDTSIGTNKILSRACIASVPQALYATIKVGFCIAHPNLANNWRVRAWSVVPEQVKGFITLCKLGINAFGHM